MITQAIGKTTGMEKRNMSTIFRISILLAVFVLSGITAQAQVLTNGGFEIAVGTNYINGTVTNPAAVGWEQFGPGFRVGTNETASPITARTCGFAMRCFNPGRWFGSRGV